jgi:hypothetical protein
MRALLTVLTLIAGAAMTLIGLVVAVVAASSDTPLPFLPGVTFFIMGGVVVLMGILCARDVWGSTTVGHVQEAMQPPDVQDQRTSASGRASSRPTTRSPAPSANSNGANEVVLTEEAATYLKKRLAKVNAGPNRFIRLRGSPSKCTLTVDRQRDEDFVLSRNGSGALLFDPATHQKFHGIMIDCVESSKGRKLKFRSRADEGVSRRMSRREQ